MSDVVNFKFGADSSEAMRALKGVHDGVQDISAGLNVVTLESMLNIFDMMKNSVKNMWDAFMGPASEIENYTVSFETLLGSAEAAAKMVATLNEYAATTPFELDGIAKATNTLLSFGLQADEAVQVLRKLGDMAAVTQTPLADLARIYGKINAVGVMDTMSIDMLSERGLNMRQLIAERDGISVADVQKNIAKRSYGRAELDYALDLATSKGGQFFEGTAKAGATLSGVISTLADNFKALRAEIGTDFMEPMKKAVNELTAHLPAIGEVVRPVVSVMSRAMADMVRNMPLVLRLMRDVAIAFLVMLAWPRIVAGAKALRAALVSVRGVLQQMNANIKAFGVGLGVCRTVGAALLGIFKAIGRVGWMLVITAAVDALSALYDKFFSETAAPPVNRDRQAAIDEYSSAVEQAHKDAEADASALDALEKRMKEAKTGEEMKAAADELAAEMKRLRAALENDGLNRDAARVREESLARAMELADRLHGYEIAQREREKAAAAQAEKEKNSAELLKTLLNIENERGTARFEENFSKLTSVDQRRVLGWLMRDFGYKGSHEFNALESGMMSALASAQAAGDTMKFETVRGYLRNLDASRKLAEQENDAAAAQVDALRRFADREAMLAARERHDTAAVNRIEAEQEATALAAELQGYGLPAAEAAKRAANIVTRERALRGSGTHGEVIADSLQRIGGGGRGFTLAEGQMQLARKHVTIAEQSRDLLAAIQKRLQNAGGTIPVVP